MSDWPNDWKAGDPPPPGYLVSKKGMLYRQPNPPRISPEAEKLVAQKCSSVLADGRRENALLTIFERQHLKAVDKWIAAQDDTSIDRPEAIRRLVEIGLKATTKRKQREQAVR
jgi:hypothetical protein